MSMEKEAEVGVSGRRRSEAEAPVGMFRVSTRSERVRNVQATTHAERAYQSGLSTK